MFSKLIRSTNAVIQQIPAFLGFCIVMSQEMPL